MTTPDRIPVIIAIGEVTDRPQQPEQALEPVSWPDSDADSEANAQTAASERVNNEKPAREAYQCTACGARIQDASEVSPKGDTRCAYCNVWFNIHRQ
jgi:DNA-directed RNA polymerase subunit RPC12/RpoP